MEGASASQAQPAASNPTQRLTDLGQRRTYLGMAWRRFRRNKLAMLGLAVLVLMIVFALCAGLISQYITGFALSDQNLMNAYQPIGAENHLLGTDDVGRDVATRLAYGARVSLGVAGLAVLGAMTIGVTVGLMAGYHGGVIDSLAMRFVDIMLSIPTLFLLLLVATLFTLNALALAGLIAAVAWVTLSRLIRGEVIAAKNRDYVDAARVVGAKNTRIIFRHILPNVAPVVIVWASLAVPALILTEASLSFLGLGIQPPDPSWGNMLSNAQRVWSRSTSLVVLPGLAIYITVFAINLMGNGLRDALDPRLTD
ncbi:MAG: ABC transporter permease [Chloroflexia bacterium]|jgi:peptide/nickel transport system permease protein|nr:ABC transporter permease [Chloroflexia bacterium]